MTGKKIDHERVWKDFDEAVNMMPNILETWLATEDSKSVGWSDDDGKDSVGHYSGRRILAIKHKAKTDLTEDDYAHMRKAVGYVHTHLAQGGLKEDIERSARRYSLMNWGRDPLEK